MFTSSDLVMRKSFSIDSSTAKIDSRVTTHSVEKRKLELSNGRVLSALLRMTTKRCP